MDPKPRKKQYDTLASSANLKMTRTPGLLAFLQGFTRSLLARRSRPDPALVQLTRRERQVLELIGRNYSNLEIANELGITPDTVKKHIANLRGKLGLANKNEVYYWLLQHKDRE